MGVACRQSCRAQAAGTFAKLSCPNERRGTFAKLSCPDERRGTQASLATEPAIAGQCRFMRTRPGMALGLTDHYANGIIAKRIIELAKAGERNPDRLCEGALEKLRGHLF